MVDLTVVFESDVNTDEANVSAWEHGLAFVLNAADVEMKLQAVFLRSVGEEQERLVRQLKQLELFEIPAVSYQESVQQELKKVGLDFVRKVSAEDLHQIFEESHSIVSV